MEFGKAIPRGILITPSHNNGYFVETGCCNLCFSDADSLVSALNDYLADPEGFERRYNRVQTQCEGGAELTEAPQGQGEGQRTEAVPQPAGRGGRGV